MYNIFKNQQNVKKNVTFALTRIQQQIVFYFCTAPQKSASIKIISKNQQKIINNVSVAEIRTSVLGHNFFELLNKG